MTALEELAIAAKAVGAQQERFRIARIIGELPLVECHCDAVDLALMGHVPTCLRDAEASFRDRLITAVFTDDLETMEEPAETSGEDRAPSTEAGSAGSSIALGGS